MFLLTLIFGVTARFLLVLPYEGTSNQILGLLRGAALAKALNRTLLVPPQIRSKHTLDCPLEEPWPTEITNGIDGEPLRQLKSSKRVFTFGKWKRWKDFGIATNNFVKNQGLSLYWTPPETSPMQSKELLSHLRAINDVEETIIIAQVQHVHFDQKFKLNVASIKRPSSYVGIHWRRGDFREACKNKDYKKCFPSLKSMLRKLDILRRKITFPPVIWVASNEDKTTLVNELKKRGWRVFYTKSKCIKGYWKDFKMLLDSTIFIPSPYSTMSRLIIQSR